MISAKHGATRKLQVTHQAHIYTDNTKSRSAISYSLTLPDTCTMSSSSKQRTTCVEDTA